MGLIGTTFKDKEVKIDGFLKKKLDYALKQQKKDFDIVFIIDGNEGTGKSTLSFTCGWYLSGGKLTMNNIAEGTEDAIDKLEHLPDKSVLIIDEGSLMFSSRDAMRKENRQLLKILNVIRQKCMILIVVAPTFFELERYLSYRRSNFLLHVYLDKKTGNRGRFIYFGSKKKRQLYINGKKNFESYAKPKGNFVGAFIKFELPFNEEYLKLKKKSLQETFKHNKVKAPTELEIRNNIIQKYYKKSPDLTKTKLAELFSLSRRQITTILKEKEPIPLAK